MIFSHLKQAWLVILLAVVLGGALATVETSLASRIESNRREEVLRQIPNLVPGATGSERLFVDGRSIYRATEEGRPVGWVVQAAGQGFADRIDVLIGLDADGERITGLYILEQKETPGLGNRIEDKGWRDGFVGASTRGAFAVTREVPQTEHEIPAITGATISSESVCDIVNAAADGARQDIMRLLRE